MCIRQTKLDLQIHSIHITISLVIVTTVAIVCVAAIACIACVAAIACIACIACVACITPAQLLKKLCELRGVEPPLSVLSLEWISVSIPTTAIGIVVAITSTRCSSPRFGAGAGSRMSDCVKVTWSCIACCI